MAAHIPISGAHPIPGDPLDFVIDPREAVVTVAVRPAFDTRSKSR